MEYGIRHATEEDVEALASLHVLSWKETYQGVVPPDVADAITEVRLREHWGARLSEAEPSQSTWVIEDGYRVVGFACIGPSRQSEDDSRQVVEIYALYMEPKYWGRGLGRALLTHVTAEVSASGQDAIVVWINTGNKKAQRFCEAAGFYNDGRTREELLFGLARREVCYRRRSERNAKRGSRSFGVENDGSAKPH